MSPTTVNDADMNNLCARVCVRQRGKDSVCVGCVCVLLSAGCVLTDEVTPCSLIIHRLVRVLLFVRVCGSRDERRFRDATHKSNSLPCKNTLFPISPPPHRPPCNEAGT